MKLKHIKALDVQNIAGDFGSRKVGIDLTETMPLIISMLSEGFYSNPIGSLVREIASNCVDSHTEAKVDEPIIIKKGVDSEGTYISFIDVGIGLSVERMYKIYMNYFSSTKRDTNEQIGGFGLGSKSPLAYCDYFFITTVSEGLKYKYVFSKGETLPELDCLGGFQKEVMRTSHKTSYLYTNEDGSFFEYTIPVVNQVEVTLPIGEETTDHNGTEIKIYIKEDKWGSPEVSKFEKEIKKQLCYFDDVYFEGWDIENKYTIYETENYKFRSINQYSDEMHILLGKVCYPIDWSTLGIKNAIEAPVGVKFEIGELLVTPNRESLRYTNELIPLIKEKIEKVKQELIDLFNKQNAVEIDYANWIKSKNKIPNILFTNEEGISHKLFLKYFDGLDKRSKFKLYEPFPDLYKNPINFFNKLYEPIKFIKDKKEVKSKDGKILVNFNQIYLEQAEQIAFYKPMSLINNWVFVRGLLVEKKKIKNSDIEIKNLFYSKPVNRTYGRLLHNKTDTYFKLGSHKDIYNLIKYFRKIFEDTFVQYGVVTPEEKEAYEEEKQRVNYALQRKINKEIVVTDLGQKENYNIKESDLEKFTGIIVYGGWDQTDDLKKALTFLNQFKEQRSRKRHIRGFSFKKSIEITGGRGRYAWKDHKFFWFLNPKACRVLTLSKENIKLIQSLNKENMINVQDLYGDNSLFRKLASSFMIEEFFINFVKNQRIDATEFVEQITNICPEIGQKLNILLEFRNDHSNEGEVFNSSYERKNIKEPVLQVAKRFDLFDPNMNRLMKEVEDWFKGVEILKFTEINEDSLPEILKYLRYNKKKLDLKYYQKVLKEEKETQLELNFDTTIVTNFTQITGVIYSNLGTIQI